MSKVSTVAGSEATAGPVPALAPGRTLPINLTLTPPAPTPLSVIDSGGLKWTIVHRIRLGMPFTSTMDSTTVPLSMVSGNLDLHTR